MSSMSLARPASFLHCKASQQMAPRLAMFAVVMVVLPCMGVLEMAHAASPLDLEIDPADQLEMWEQTTRTPGYDDATAHKPRYDDAVVWPASLEQDGEPAYRRQEWEPARVLIWDRRDGRREGRTVSVLDPSNWVRADGEPAEAPPDKDTDVVFPDHDEPYYVHTGKGDRHEESFHSRHLTVGRNADVNVMGLRAHGNWWIKQGGYIYERHGGGFQGEAHTFARNDNVPQWRPGMPAPDRDADLDAMLLRSNSQYFTIEKPGASVEFVGHVSTQDQFRINAGAVIVAPDSYLGFGERGSMSIRSEGVLQLQSGSASAKRLNQNFNWDIVVEGGTIRAGSPERPIRRDCLLGLSAKDHWGRVNDLSEYGDRGGLNVKSGSIEVHRDAAEAHLHVMRQGLAMLESYRTREQGDWQYDKWRRTMDALEAGFPYLITLKLPDDMPLAHVVFHDLRFGGIRGPGPEALERWEDVHFADSCQGDAVESLAHADWYSAVQIMPPGPIAELNEDAPEVRLNAVHPEARIHYTLDGEEPTEDSPIYREPIAIKGSTVVHARAWHDGDWLGETARADLPSSDDPMPSADVEPGRSGLRWRAGQRRAVVGGWDFDGEPAGSGHVEALDLQPARRAVDGGGVLVELEGYLLAPRTGRYDFEMTGSDHPIATVSLNGVRILQDTHRTSRDARRVALEAGPHSLRVHFIRDFWGDWTLEMAWAGPGFERRPITAEDLRH